MAELAAIEAESIGWLPLGDGAYLAPGQAGGGRCRDHCRWRAGGGDGGDECAAGGVSKLTRKRLREVVEVVVVNADCFRPVAAIEL